MNTATALSFVHRFEPAREAGLAPLLLLHGTGGDEDDLVGLGRAVAPVRALLSPRGKVLENGMPRFFRRLAEGVFDEADIIRRAGELADFVADARDAYDLPAPVAVGVSNGANIAAAVLLLRPDVLAGAALIRAMPPFAEPPAADLAGRPVLVLSGTSDPIVPASQAARLVAQLRGARAEVDSRSIPAGHGLSQADVTQLAGWLRGSSVP